MLQVFQSTSLVPQLPSCCGTLLMASAALPVLVVTPDTASPGLPLRRQAHHPGSILPFTSALTVLLSRQTPHTVLTQAPRRPAIHSGIGQMCFRAQVISVPTVVPPCWTRSLGSRLYGDSGKPGYNPDAVCMSIPHHRPQCLGDHPHPGVGYTAAT